MLGAKLELAGAKLLDIGSRDGEGRQACPDLPKVRPWPGRQGFTKQIIASSAG